MTDNENDIPVDAAGTEPTAPDLRLTGDAATAPDGMDPSDLIDSMEARVKLKSLDLPETGTLSQTDRANVLRLVRDHIKKYKLPYSVLALQLGVGESTVSEVLNRKYRGDVDGVLRKLNSWLDSDEATRRQRAEPLGYYETNVLTAIRDAAIMAKRAVKAGGLRDGRTIVMATGPSGCGKDVGAQALRDWDRNAILIRARTGRTGGLGLAQLIAEAEGWRGRAPHQSHADWVIERLRDSNRLLIVNEAHRVAPSGFNYLRDLADVCGIPILLLGTEEMSLRVTARRVGAHRSIDEQFASRVLYRVDLLRGSDGKGGTTRPIYSIAEITAIFAADRVRLTEDGAEFLQGIACNVQIGMLRMAANIFTIALRRARHDDGRIDAARLAKAAKRVLVPAGVEFDAFSRTITAQVETNRRLAAAAG